MDRITRKELKSDRFAQEVTHTVEYVSGHRRQLLRYGAIAAALALVTAGIYLYIRYQRGIRQDELRAALRIQEANVGPAEGNPFSLSYATQKEKDAAAVRAFSELARKHPGTTEAAIAQYYLGGYAANRGDLKEARSHFEQVIATGDAAYASLAKLSLAQVLAGQKEAAEAEKLLRSLVDHPTVLVSKETAIIELAKLVAQRNPVEARALLEPLRAARSPVSRAALGVLGPLLTNP